MQIYLTMLDRAANRFHGQAWSKMPRIYAILRSIGGLEFMDEFIKNDMNDFWLPFNERTLPEFLRQREGTGLRQAFLAVQNYYLTHAKSIETEGATTHFHLPEGGDTHFIPVKTLGQGSFG